MKNVAPDTVMTNKRFMNEHVRIADKILQQMDVWPCDCVKAIVARSKQWADANGFDPCEALMVAYLENVTEGHV